MKHIPLIFLVAALVLTACGAAATPAPSFYETAPQAGVGGAGSDQSRNLASSVAEAPKPGSPDTFNSGQSAAANAVRERLVIQNADLAIVVTDPQAKMLEIRAMAQHLGGFEVSSNMGQVYSSGNVKVMEGSITIRVPAKDLDAALAEIKANTIEVQTDNRSGQDVTDQYVDLQSQLKAKQAAAEKLYEMLQKTEKVEDTRLIFNDLTQMQSEIEVLKGQINYFEQAAALSAISVRLVAEQTIKPIEIAGWQPQGVARDALQTLIDFFQGFANFLIWLVIFILPVAVIIIILLAVLFRLLRWFWRKVFPAAKKTAAPAAPIAPAESTDLDQHRSS